ncbi:MAG: hypothetical protein JWO55_863 [Candidatus Saccharibacteria bacterium]|jgi:hypothetical protein|nr:hypothetical protein [Candidatus Saccharibacteria bacterium]
MDDEDEDLQRNPKEWSSGREPMTEAQRIELEMLSNQTGEPTSDEHLTKAEASEKIEELRQEAGIDSSDDEADTVLGDDG